MNEASIKEIALEIELVLLRNKCNVKSTYDYSHVIVEKVSDSDEYQEVKNNGIYFSGSNGYFEDPDEAQERIDNKQTFDICKKELELIMLRHNVRLNTTYDMSHALLIDGYGNTDSI